MNEANSASAERFLQQHEANEPASGMYNSYTTSATSGGASTTTLPSLSTVTGRKRKRVARRKRTFSSPTQPQNSTLAFVGQQDWVFICQWDS
ncbi:hypothetical protein AX17_002635 [Amanita inopinata Kibby_2008]|nr:hypothetical protein AX17_002635 [Amanita inopinata Kibby_2008]